MQADAKTTNLTAIWRQVIGIDLRTLALFRIGLAVTILIDLATFWPHLSLFLTDEGIFPRWMAIASRAPESLSLYFAGGQLPFLLLLMTITTLAALALMFGYYTRIASVICWVMIASLNVRASVYLSSADIQLVVMLFWAMFLPLGARFSIDHALSREPTSDTRCVSVASLAILLQVAYVYVMGALLKTGDPWRLDYTAVEYAISAHHMATSLAGYLEPWREVQKYLTIFVLHLELYAVFFLFCPIFNAQLRLLVLLPLVLMHLGFFTFLAISIFPPVSLTGLTVFIPALFWDRIAGWLRQYKSLTGLRIYYDGDCEFCKKTCLIFRELGIIQDAVIEPAQTVPDIYKIMQEENSWVIKTADGKILLHWEAVAYMWRRSPLLWPLGAIFLLPVMKRAGTAIYRCIAKNRGALGKFTARLLPYRQSVSVRASLVNSVVVAPLIIIVLVVNLRNLEAYKFLPYPKIFQDVVVATQLAQKWNMFAPAPISATNWTVMEGHLANGDRVDLMFDRMTPPRHELPRMRDHVFPLERWYKFVTFYKWERYGPTFARTMCRRWKQSHPDAKLERVVITNYSQKTLLGTQRDTWPVTTKQVLDYSCEAKPAPAK